VAQDGQLTLESHTEDRIMFVIFMRELTCTYGSYRNYLEGLLKITHRGAAPEGEHM
jgi:hypothetical protein